MKARTHLAQPSIRNEQNPQLAPPHLRPLGGGSGEGVDGLDLQDLNLSDRPLNRVTSTSCRRGALEITDSGAPRPTLELRQIAGCALVADPVGRAFWRASRMQRRRGSAALRYGPSTLNAPSRPE